MQPKPKVYGILHQWTQYNKFVEWIKELGFSAWITVNMVLMTIKQRWTKFIKKSLFSAQSKEFCSSKYWMRMVTGVLEIATVLSLFIPGSSLHRGFLLLYSPFWTILDFHLLIIQAYTWVSVPLDTLSSVLWVVVTEVALFRGLVHINTVLAAFP